MNEKGPAARRLRIWCSEEANLPPSEEIQLQRLPSELTREQYLKQMASTQLVILPYQAQFYTNRFSGIMLDAIQLGKIPVVPDGTFMAEELRKYDLEGSLSMIGTVRTGQSSWYR